VGARRLGQDEQYFTVREILSEASTLADGALSRERSDFCRFGYATLGFTLLLQRLPSKDNRRSVMGHFRRDAACFAFYIFFKLHN
jgi:hypothetical protein